MTKLSETATRILNHLYNEADITMRMVGSICMALSLDTPDWQSASEELLAARLMVKSGASFSLTLAGIALVESTREASPPDAEAPAQETAPTTSPLPTSGPHPFIDFMVAYNHDLRSPLNSIIGFSRVILKGIDGPINDMQAEDLQSVYEGGQKLLSMLTEIVDMARVEAGVIALVPKHIDVAMAFKEIVDKIKGQLVDKPVTLHNDLPLNALTVWADETRLRQVLLNVAGFCAQNIDMGSICFGGAYKDGRACITITDTGNGWPPAEVAVMLRPYRPPDQVHHIGGVGLRLAIAHRLAALLDGTLTVASRVGEGTVFTLTLPVEPPEPPEAAG